MTANFSTFTPEAMRAVRQDLARAAQDRTGFFRSIHDQTLAMRESFRKEQRDAERKRREGAERAADARRLFMSELRSDVHALLERFELSRREVAGDLEAMASELGSARAALRRRR